MEDTKIAATYNYPITDTTKISKRPDGSFVLDDIYHVPANGEYGEFFKHIAAIAEARPDRVEIIAPPSESEVLADMRAGKLAKLKSAFLLAEQNGVLESAVGFAIDANERANRDISGLITSLETTGTDKTSFCAADNSFHEVSLENLKVMQLEVIRYGQALYAAKWKMRSAIESAGNIQELEKIRVDFGDLA